MFDGRRRDRAGLVRQGLRHRLARRPIRAGGRDRPVGLVEASRAPRRAAVSTSRGRSTWCSACGRSSCSARSGRPSCGWISSPPGALAFGLVVPVLAAYAVYRTLFPVRSATGSAFALRAESFRRFLKASEGRHVEWAWKQGLLREYSAWAVALGAADAWERAMHASSVAPVELATRPAARLHDGAVVESARTPHRPAPAGAAASGAAAASAAAGSAAASPAAASGAAAAAAAPAPGDPRCATHPRVSRQRGFPAGLPSRNPRMTRNTRVGSNRLRRCPTGSLERCVFFASGAVLVLEILAGRLLAAVRRRLDRDVHRDHRRRPRRHRHRCLARWRAGRPVRSPAAAARDADHRRRTRHRVGARSCGCSARPALTPVRARSSCSPRSRSSRPSAVLTAVTPIIVKLQLRELEQTGRVVGWLSAMGTAGHSSACSPPGSSSSPRSRRHRW